MKIARNLPINSCKQCYLLHNPYCNHSITIASDGEYGRLITNWPKSDIPEWCPLFKVTEVCL